MILISVLTVSRAIFILRLCQHVSLFTFVFPAQPQACFQNQAEIITCGRNRNPSEKTQYSPFFLRHSRKCHRDWAKPRGHPHCATTDVSRGAARTAQRTEPAGSEASVGSSWVIWLRCYMLVLRLVVRMMYIPRARVVCNIIVFAAIVCVAQKNLKCSK